MARVVDGSRIVDGTVIHPDDHVPRVVSIGVHGHALAIGTHRNERASRVETQTHDRDRRYIGDLPRFSYRAADRIPDVTRRLLDVIGLRIPDLQRSLAAAQ